MAMVEEKTPQPAATEENSPAQAFKDEALRPEVGINVSGHKQELQRNFGLLSLCGLGLTSGNVWMALGGSIVRSRYTIYIRRLLAYPGPYRRLWLSTTEAHPVSSTNTSLPPSSTGSSELPSPNWPQPSLHLAEVGIPTDHHPTVCLFGPS